METPTKPSGDEYWWALALFAGMGLLIWFQLGSDPYAKGMPPGRSDPAVAAADYAFTKGKEDGGRGRRMTERMMTDSGWTALQKSNYRSGRDTGEYDSK